MNVEARVQAALAIARRVADASDALGGEVRSGLLSTIGLSREGIELALTEHLETSVSDEDLGRLSASTHTASTVTVVLSANVCVAPLRAIVLGLVTATHVRVKASRRDPTLARVLVRELRSIVESDGGSIVAIDEIAFQTGEAIHVYGADQTIDAIRERLVPGQTLWAHGTGFGIALVAASDELDDATRAIARDVVPFDQRGCLSPRIVLVEGDATRARSVAVSLDASLDDLGRRVPRGEVDDRDRADLAAYVTLMRSAGEVFAREDHVVALDPEPTRLWMGPAARTVHVLPASAADLPPLLRPLVPHIATVGGSKGAWLEAAGHVCPGARRSTLGRMQRPPLDGPVDLRTRPALPFGGD